MTTAAAPAGDGNGSPDAGDDVVELRLDVPGMDCASCAGKVEDAFVGVDGITGHEEQPTTGSAVVYFDESATSEAEIVAAVEAAGYEVTGTGTDRDTDRAEIWTSPRALKTWAGGVFVALGLLFEFVLGDANALLAAVGGSDLHVADALFLAAVALGGQEILREGARSARALRLDIDFLMSVAILGALTTSLAFGESLYFEAATLAVLFSIAELLEAYAMDRARQSLRELMELSPDEATVRRDGEEVTVPVEAVEVGEVVVVRPGEKVPTDGVVVDGESAIDQSPVTGESVPVEKTGGDEVYAGTVNETGYLEIQVTSAAGDDTLSRIVEMVEDAQSNRTEREQYVERFATYYTPAVVAFAILTTLGTPFLFGVTWPTAVVYGLTLLVLACPCAFVISTPVSVVSGITSAANNGVLVKGGNHLEAMGAVEAVAVDKTGTLTRGELAVTDLLPLGDADEATLLRRAAALERRSEHPIAAAILDRAEGASVTDVAEPTAFESLTGRGVRAEIDGETYYAGKPALFEDLGFDLSRARAETDGGVVETGDRDRRAVASDDGAFADGAIAALEREGKTVVL